MVEVAGLIGDAVHEVSPTTRVGLMSSVPEVHCAEGRDWAGRAWRGPLLSGRSGPVGGLVLAVQSDLKNVPESRKWGDLPGGCPF